MPDTDQVNERADVAIVCALYNPELKMVLETGKQPWVKHQRMEHDPSIYYRTEFITTEGTPLSVVAAAPARMGLAASAVLATKMIISFRPRLVVMVGIAAGADRKSQNFGDILAADKTFDYGAGKEKVEAGSVVFQPDPDPIAIQTQLLDKLKQWDKKKLDGIHAKWIADGNADLPKAKLRLHIGPIASGAAVIDHIGVVAEVKSNWRKLIGIEMEAYGVHRACEDSTVPPTAYLCFKSICDFAEEKGDEWQSYAAFTAAQYCYSFLESEWDRLHFTAVSQIPKRLTDTATELVPAQPTIRKSVQKFLAARLETIVSHWSETERNRHLQNMEREMNYGDEVAFLTCFGTYVGVDLNQEEQTFRRLTGVATKVQRWEVFTILDPEAPDEPSSRKPLHYGDKIALRAAGFESESGRIVGADFNAGGEIGAKHDCVQEWQVFTILPHPELNREYGVRLSFGFPFALKSSGFTNGASFKSPFVMFNRNGDRTLLAVVDKISLWETFLFVDPNNPIVSA